jgi:hypothetical protein
MCLGIPAEWSPSLAGSCIVQIRMATEVSVVRIGEIVRIVLGKVDPGSSGVIFVESSV